MTNKGKRINSAENFFLTNNDLIFKFIKNNILFNDFYFLIKKEYTNATKQQKREIINNIIDAFKMFDCYYSIYAVMDTIENELEKDDKATIENIINNEYFSIKE